MDPQHVDPYTGEIKPGELFFRTGYNYDRDAASVESGLECKDPSLTQQQFAEDADINTIVRRFGITGKLPEGVRLPSYGDFTGVSDFRSAIAAIEQAEAAFMQMPANVRARFDNDPGAFVDFCSDDRNYAEAQALGLVKVPEQVPAAQGGPTASAPPSPAPTPTA